MEVSITKMMTNDVDFYSHIQQGLVTLSRIPLISYAYNPRQLVFQHGKIKIYHYQPKVKQIISVPLLVVFATVNRPEILDIFPERSFIGGLLQNGMDVYLLDWGYPDLSDRDTTFADYVTDYLHACVEYVSGQHRNEPINLLGICQGGLMCLCYAALFPLHKLILISAPVDFKTEDNTISRFIQHIDFETMAAVTGNILGSWLTQFFISLRPFELVGKKYLRFIDNIENQTATERFLRVEKWLYDAPDQAANAFLGFINEFYKANKLIKGDLSLNGKKVNLENVIIPVMNVMANEDEIIPVSASKVLKKYIRSKNYTERTFPSGHIGIYVSEKVGASMTSAIANWLKE